MDPVTTFVIGFLSGSSVMLVIMQLMLSSIKRDIQKIIESRKLEIDKPRGGTVILRDRLGWPVERIKGRPVTNAIRLLLHTSLWQTWRHRNCRCGYCVLLTKQVRPHVTEDITRADAKPSAPEP